MTLIFRFALKFRQHHHYFSLFCFFLSFPLLWMNIFQLLVFKTIFTNFHIPFCLLLLCMFSWCYFLGDHEMHWNKGDYPLIFGNAFSSWSLFPALTSYEEWKNVRIWEQMGTLVNLNEENMENCNFLSNNNMCEI